MSTLNNSLLRKKIRYFSKPYPQRLNPAHIPSMKFHSVSLTFTTVPQVLRLKLRLMCVPLETPRQEEFDRKSSNPPTRSLGTDTVIELGSHWTGTAGEEDREANTFTYISHVMKQFMDTTKNSIKTFA